MSTQVLERPRTDDNSADDDYEVHLWCHCSPNRTLCGIDFEEAMYDDDDDEEITCVVCIDLENRPCERCGCI